jgi:adenylate kinase
VIAVAEAIAPLSGEDDRAMALNVVMLGAPGAGKGTQAERLAAEAGVPRISTGDILRAAVAADTPLGRSARTLMDAGRLVGDDIVVALVRERLARPDAAAGFVLDGFPRTVAQAEALDDLVRGRGPLVVVHVAVPTEVLVRRLSSRRVCGSCGTNRPDGAGPGSACPRCGGTFVQRPDDGEAVVRERLRVFARQTEPLVAYYRAGWTVFDVDGDQPVDRVAEQVRGVVRRATGGETGPGKAS